MSLQKKILNDFRQHFPTHTLREIAALTDIQLTRVFRLINGAPMKLEEFEAFTIAIQNHTSSHTSQHHLDRLISEVKNRFSVEEQKKVAHAIEIKLQWHSIVIGDTSENIFNLHTA
jgi:hypothetical protein